MPKQVLTDKHKAYIRSHYLKQSTKAMARAVGCSSTAVRRFMRLNDLIVSADLKRHFKATAMAGRTSFTEAEDDIIKAHYLTMPIKRMVKQLLPGRSFIGVAGRLKAMGLTIPPEIVQARKESTRIKQGNVSHNKGKKLEDFLSPEQIEGLKANQFKKGQLPHNTRSDNAISLRTDKSGLTYKYIRVSLGKWELLQREVWKQHHGSIPPKHMITFKDGDQLNCDIGNLECISMAENAIRNSGVINLADKTVAHYLSTKSKKVDEELKQEILTNHPELISLKRSQLLLNRAIKNHGKSSNRKSN